MRTMRRWKNKPTEKLMMYISEYFKHTLESKKVYDAGVWVIEIQNENGEKWSYI